MKVFVEKDNVDFGVGEANMVSNGTVDVVFGGGVGVVFDGVVGGVSDGAVGVYVHPKVCDFFVGVAFRNTSSNILTWVPSPSFNVLWLLEIGRIWSIKFLMLLIWMKEKCGASCRLWHWWI
jgi:hypothetical protein